MPRRSWDPLPILKMECIHGVISLHHHVEGVMTTKGQSVCVMERGIWKKTGYFVSSATCGFQSNQCGVSDSCFFLSLASIPLGPLTFNGLLVVKLQDQSHASQPIPCRLTSLYTHRLEKGSGWARLQARQGSWDIKVDLSGGPASTLASL